MEEGTGEALAGLGSIEQDLALLDYSASNTNSAQNPSTSASSHVYLNTSETVMIGTCGINESTFTGNTYLRLYNPSGANVATNDNGLSYGCGYGSKLNYTAPDAGYYFIRAGCYSSTSCSGTVALSRRKGIFSFSASNTNDATISTYNKQFSFNAGEVVRISTCSSGAYGASSNGNTYLRLFKNVSGLYSEVAISDDGFGCGLASEIIYTVPTSGYYQLRAGCFSSDSCSGAVAVYVE
jgi:hypothetical protein